MKLLFYAAILIISNASPAQEVPQREKAIDSAIQRIEQSTWKEASFTIQALKKPWHYIHYSSIGDKSGYVKISRRFSFNNDSIQQIFYLNNGQLIHASEIIITYFNNNGSVDSIGWSGGFYFSKNKLISYTTLGHGKSEKERWDPEREILMAFQESKRDMARYKKNRKAG